MITKIYVPIEKSVHLSTNKVGNLIDMSGYTAKQWAHYTDMKRRMEVSYCASRITDMVIMSDTIANMTGYEVCTTKGFFFTTFAFRIPDKLTLPQIEGLDIRGKYLIYKGGREEGMLTAKNKAIAKLQMACMVWEQRKKDMSNYIFPYITVDVDLPECNPDTHHRDDGLPDDSGDMKYTAELPDDSGN